MESIVYEDTPLADYLEGAGEGDRTWSQAPETPSLLSSDTDSVSFAPRGRPQVTISRRRGQPDISNVQTSRSIRATLWLTQIFKDLFAIRLSASENARFLEQLRFTIVGSQLLSDRTAIGYKPAIPGGTALEIPSKSKADDVSYTTTGVYATLAVAFVAVWALDWARPQKDGEPVIWRLIVVLSLLTTAATFLYVFIKRQYTRYLRSTTLEAVSSMIANAQSFDAAAATASTLVQEVEIVSRGYRLSSPLPPASRFEDNQIQLRRCTRLRRALQASLDSLIAPHAEAFFNLRPLVIESDLDQYFDIYELSQTDVAEAEDVQRIPAAEGENDESLKSLRVKLHRLHILRKLYLCSILALDIGESSLFPGWTLVTETMNRVSDKSASAAATLDKILSEEQQFPTLESPKATATPRHQRLHAQVRKFTALSQGVRGLQAKMQILREESDRSLNSSEEVTDLGSSLLDHYDAIGADLKSLVQDWEEGRAALTANIDKNERRVSQISSGAILSSPTTPVSLGGLTAVGESPIGALKTLNGESISSASASDEEVFEAIAMPRQRPRSTLTRDERIALAREERARQALSRDKADASRHMLKELETVIKMRPRGTTTGRMSMPS